MEPLHTTHGGWRTRARLTNVHQCVVESGQVVVSSCRRELLQKDEAILQQLLQQEIKKKESLKAAEVKVTKLREQLLASERIVGANKTLLRKLQEQVCVELWRCFLWTPFCWFMHDVFGFLQVQRVEHRVSEKKSQAVRFEQELSHAQLMANRGTKRKMNSGGLLVSYRHDCFYSFISVVWVKSE